MASDQTTDMPEARPVEETTHTEVFTQDRPGLLVTTELEKAIAACKAQVDRIAKECRMKNKKFRDIEFDLDNDKTLCLHGLTDTAAYAPSDVQRVTQIFEDPQFFVGGTKSSVVQGALGDCWFLSALAALSTSGKLVENSCVARDEQVGVYGFIFFRDCAWVSVVIDDMLYTRIPKYEELNSAEKQLYHNDKEMYNQSARRGGKGLYFAKSETAGETWVPLIEKAYAKLHGDYAALKSGRNSEALEDLTGGVSTILRSRDILDLDVFWENELSKANEGRIFGCSFPDLSSARSGVASARVQGLIGGHAYSVLRAVECKGKRFVIVHNPWGNSEWTGPWSDGSKEWTSEWLEILPTLGHSFGNDGQFVMEYGDFLECWDYIHRTFLFDSSWIMSNQWLQVTAPPLPSAWSHGDISFTFSLTQASPTIVVLSQLDGRYFLDITGRWYWNLEFVLFKKGEEDPIAESTYSSFFSRSVNVELDLEAGDYIVQVRLDRDRRRSSNYFSEALSEWNKRKLSRVLAQRAQSQSIASNFKRDVQARHLPIPLKALLEEENPQPATEASGTTETPAPKKATSTTTTTTTTVTTTSDGSSPGTVNNITVNPGAPQPVAAPPPPPAFPEIPEEDDSLIVGLRVYTKKESPVVVVGKVRERYKKA